MALPFRLRAGVGPDAIAGLSLFSLAMVCYAALFLGVPVLTEVRDFLFYQAWAASIWHIPLPTGNDYRPFSWVFFRWQRELFGFDPQPINLVQFALLGFCAVAGYTHLRQLELKPTRAFAASVLWLFSFAAMHAAFWQATQHDKLGFLLTIVTLSVALHALRLKRPALTWLFAIVLTLLVALAVATKPVAFVLAGALVVQAVLFVPGRTATDYRRAALLIGPPVVYATVYALAYQQRMDPAWSAHVTGGDLPRNLLVYLKYLTNIDYDGPLWPAVLLFSPVGLAWAWAVVTLGRARESRELPFTLLTTRLRRHAVQVYFCAIAAGCMALLIRAEFPVAFYLLIPVYAFTGSLAVLKESLDSGSGLRRRLAAGVVILVALGLLVESSTNLRGDARLAQWRRSALALGDGYDVLRNAVDPSVVESVAFVLPANVEGNFYFFSDGRHTVIDPLLPSFIFRDEVKRPIKSLVQSLPPPETGTLIAVWSDDLRLSSASLSGNTLYRNAGVPSSLRWYLPGQPLNFGKAGNASMYQTSGWSWPEDDGTWTDGREAILTLTLDRRVVGPLEIAVRAKAFVDPEHPAQTVALFANRTRIVDWTIPDGDAAELTAMIPEELAGSSSLELVFHVEHALVPAHSRHNGDLRLLGIKVERVILREPHVEGGRPATSVAEPVTSPRRPDRTTPGRRRHAA
jgi:hypothetical protein